MEDQTTQKPLVSIITVVLDAADTIEEAMASVFEQDHRPLEYIVIDGGSSDGTREKIEQYADRIDQLIEGPDEGIYDAMNKGIERANGSIIGILNADDRFFPGAVERAVEREQREDAGIIHGAMEIRFPEKGMSRVNHGDPGLLPYKASVHHPTCFVRQKVYEELGSYDTRYRISADHDFLLRAYLTGIPFAYVEEPQVSYRYGGASLSCKSDLETFRILREHGTGHHRKCLIRYLKCLAKRSGKRILGRSA
ncbi:MAG: glycosyltransferase family 2 protein [Flavobacteriales bacterium]